MFIILSYEHYEQNWKARSVMMKKCRNLKNGDSINKWINLLAVINKSRRSYDTPLNPRCGWHGFGSSSDFIWFHVRIPSFSYVHLDAFRSSNHVNSMLHFFRYQCSFLHSVIYSWASADIWLTHCHLVALWMMCPMAMQLVFLPPVQASEGSMAMVKVESKHCIEIETIPYLKLD